MIKRLNDLPNYSNKITSQPTLAQVHRSTPEQRAPAKPDYNGILDSFARLAGSAFDKLMATNKASVVDNHYRDLETFMTKRIEESSQDIDNMPKDNDITTQLVDDKISQLDVSDDIKQTLLNKTHAFMNSKTMGMVIQAKAVQGKQLRANLLNNITDFAKKEDKNGIADSILEASTYLSKEETDSLINSSNKLYHKYIAMNHLDQLPIDQAMAELYPKDSDGKTLPLVGKDGYAYSDKERNELYSQVESNFLNRDKEAKRASNQRVMDSINQIENGKMKLSDLGDSSLTQLEQDKVSDYVKSEHDKVWRSKYDYSQTIEQNHQRNLYQDGNNLISRHIINSIADVIAYGNKTGLNGTSEYQLMLRFSTKAPTTKQKQDTVMNMLMSELLKTGGDSTEVLSIANSLVKPGKDGRPILRADQFQKIQDAAKKFRAFKPSEDIYAQIDKRKDLTEIEKTEAKRAAAGLFIHLINTKGGTNDIYSSAQVADMGEKIIRDIKSDTTKKLLQSAITESVNKGALNSFFSSALEDSVSNMNSGEYIDLQQVMPEEMGSLQKLLINEAMKKSTNGNKYEFDHYLAGTIPVFIHTDKNGNKEKVVWDKVGKRMKLVGLRIAQNEHPYLKFGYKPGSFIGDYLMLEHGRYVLNKDTIGNFESHTRKILINNVVQNITFIHPKNTKEGWYALRTGKDGDYSVKILGDYTNDQDVVSTFNSLLPISQGEIAESLANQAANQTMEDAKNDPANKPPIVPAPPKDSFTPVIPEQSKKPTRAQQIQSMTHGSNAVNFLSEYGGAQ